ncbi:arsenosugar biosynthesis radical SAM protein ArsS [Geomonas paludis]|uniref:Arsenosugar biosynthesis radical SAM protein ArsS n=1 Tax=Geomonas paludis TaxID=2740185 RepID=A0A6V8MZ99_9BACT|nr:arsenosugar biosynthesis radical SAM (seleno)protein ArsS [Geomonas paludis]UPU37061.1 arsenosugar biosynthesis radical SAM protein ArsS [Geomonas paludis]GFO64843.1 radical SAM/Cys-rich domain protein [Geomonas paludis]
MDQARQRQGESFGERLARHGLALTRERTTALQVNVGLACDLACGHCHLEAGPARDEMMQPEVMAEVIACARRFRFASIDLTGGAPELVPELPYLVRGLAPETPRLIVRTNLVSLEGERGEELLRLYRELQVVLVASLPAGNQAQTEAQRGAGVWDRSIRALKRLNELGYGLPGSPLELDLVSNPSGAFLPPPQLQAQEKFRRDLARKHGVSFHNLYTFANVPLGRFRSFLERSGNLDGYLETLSAGFNPCAVAGLMCRSQLSVDWRGRLFDCDFHLAQGLFHGGAERFISALSELPPCGTPIAAADHCYACTVGSGFT